MLLMLMFTAFIGREVALAAIDEQGGAKLPLENDGSSQASCRYRLVRFYNREKSHWGITLDMQENVPKDVYQVTSYLENSDAYNAKFMSKACHLSRQLKSNDHTFDKVALTRDMILPPIARPQSVVAVGQNYDEHGEETGQAKKIITFPKHIAPTSAFAPIPRPSESHLDYEVELALVIKREIGPQTVIDQSTIFQLIAGFVLADDVSNRIPIIRDSKKGYAKGKTHTGFLPLGPYFVPLSAVPKEQWVRPAFPLITTVNKRIRQNSNSSKMRESLVAILKKIIKSRNEKWVDARGETYTLINGQQKVLMAGDLVLTGTPSGTAIKAPNRLLDKLALLGRGLLNFKGPREQKIEEDKANLDYLSVGDISKKYGGILGTMENKIIEANSSRPTTSSEDEK